jgi:hypothetical protein
MKILYPFCICLLSAALLCTGCIRYYVPLPQQPTSPTGPTGPTGQSLSISGASPTQGPLGTQVTISGKGFSDTLSLDTVYINGKIAVITSASDTQLVVTIPTQAGTGAISVDVNGTTATGPVFTYVPEYFVSTLAGGASGSVDGTGSKAGFGAINNLTTDGSGNLYLGDLGNDKIRTVTTDLGVVATFAGSGLVTADADGTLATAGFASPADVIIRNNIIYVLDAGSGTNGASIRMISGNNVSTICGGGAQGFLNATGTAAQFSNCWGFAMDAAGNFYVADAGNNVIRMVTPAGVVSTFAGSGATGSQNGPAASATFSAPNDIAIDKAGNLYVSDEGNNMIRMITPAGVVSTFAGSGQRGHTDATGTAATFFLPEGLAFDNNGNLYVADMSSNRIRMITPAAVVTTIAGSSPGWIDGLASTASFNDPTGVTVDANGVIYVADGNDVVRKIALQ